MSVAAAPERKVRCRLIAEGDLEAVADLLARGFEKRPRSYFLNGLLRLAARAVPEGLPRFGYMLEAEGRAVGAVLLAFYQRPGLDEPRCNIASWYVEPAHRMHAAMLSSMALKQKQVTYLNVTPAANTWPILEAQGYKCYCKGLMLAFPALSGSAGVSIERVTPNTKAVAGLPDHEVQMLKEQLAYGCVSLIARKGGAAMPFVFLPFRMRSGRVPLPLMQLVYCRNVDEFVACAGPLGRALLKHGKIGVLVDADGKIPGLMGAFTEKRGKKFYKGPGHPQHGDLLDTEFTLFGP
ncbi:acyl-CoA acyltransferase [Aestuariivirga litoralis]|uniref:acyl-CoA acyltransferase n=1 Tax=Aestuariivirga litoralis TaxID=2650924 RepID=UPI0018C6900A|nr:acyl-CoA acyltransferase [Aestuariivirga litoralis]MBG1233865.1 acyl-CoA acyltransferase [Aestuariivirga litoralis]